MQPLIVINGFKQKSLSNVGRTVDFTTKIDQIVQYCKDNPNQPIIYESYSAWDYEPIVSVDRFLKAHGVANTIYLNMKSYTNENYDGGLERKLADELSSVSINGGILADSAKFNSYRSEYLDNCVECLRLGFSGEDVSESAYYRIW